MSRCFDPNGRTVYCTSTRVFVGAFACLTLFAIGSDRGWGVAPAAAQQDSAGVASAASGGERVVAPPGVSVPGEDVRKSLDTITTEELLNHTSYLASDALEGREAGTGGGQKAGDYLIEQVRAIGLEPAGPDGQYVQPCGGNMRNVLAKISGSDPQGRRKRS